MDSSRSTMDSSRSTMDSSRSTMDSSRFTLHSTWLIDGKTSTCTYIALGKAHS